MKNIKKTKYYFAYIMCGILTLTLALMLAPFWGKIWENCPWVNVGSKIVSYAIATLIFLYLFAFVIKKIKKSTGTIKFLTLIEFTVLGLISIGLVINQLQILNISNPSVILGVAFYARGVIELFRAYYHQKESTNKYPISWLIVAILFVTVGVYFMVSKLITTEIILYVLVGSLILFGLYLLFYGLLSKPVLKQNKK